MKKKRKVRKSFLAIMGVFIIAVCVILSVTVLFPIEKTVVEYDGTRYTKEEIVKASGVKLGENIIMFSTAEAEKAVEKQLPYIKKLTVSRSFPNEIVLKATEGKESYCLKNGKNYLITDEEFKILSVSQTPNKSLVCINGGINNTELGEKVSFKKENDGEILAQVSKKFAKRKLNYIDFSDSSNIVFYLDGKFKIDLGTESALSEKLDFLQKMLSDIESKNEKSTGTVNMRYFESKNEGYFSREEIKTEYFK